MLDNVEDERLTCQCQLHQVVATVSPSSSQHSHRRVADVLAVSQVQSVQMRHVSLYQPQSGLADVKAGQTQRRYVPQPAARRLSTCRKNTPGHSRRVAKVGIPLSRRWFAGLLTHTNRPEQNVSDGCNLAHQVGRLSP